LYRLRVRNSMKNTGLPITIHPTATKNPIATRVKE
jgi:hypothetical protein